MKFRFTSFKWFAVLAIIPVLWACSGRLEPTPTATQIFSPTQTALPASTPTMLPTETPAETATSEPTEILTATETANPLVLSGEPYQHSEGLFEVFPPEGWQVDEDESSTAFIDPNSIGFIYLQVTNTGYELEPQAFENFIDARETNFFGTYDAYQQLDQQIDVAQRIGSVSKTLEFEGVTQTIVTYYDQKGPAIYVIDFWADADQFESYNPVYNEFFEKITVDSSTAASLPLYAWVFTFLGPDDLYSIEVPTSWRFTTDEGENALIETFYAPDDHALIQNITYDDGSQISASAAGKKALELLNSYYAADIVITNDQVQPDGSERLTWYSPGGDYRGVSFLETRGTTFLLFTVMYDTPFEDTYLDVLEYTVSSYSVP